jgi:hypothetical protein
VSIGNKILDVLDIKTSFQFSKSLIFGISYFISIFISLHVSIIESLIDPFIIPFSFNFLIFYLLKKIMKNEKYLPLKKNIKKIIPISEV